MQDYTQKQMYQNLLRAHNLKTRRELEKKAAQEEAARLQEAINKSSALKYNAVLARARPGSVQLLIHSKRQGMSNARLIEIWGRELVMAARAVESLKMEQIV
tara:strand:+ start:3436 stop:3741 length:306 start_codon:yes stop_codon:yes gene_type:complete